MNENQTDQISSSELLPGVAPGSRDKASAEMEQVRRCPERRCPECDGRIHEDHNSVTCHRCEKTWPTSYLESHVAVPESVEDATPGNKEIGQPTEKG